MSALPIEHFRRPARLAYLLALGGLALLGPGCLAAESDGEPWSYRTSDARQCRGSSCQEPDVCAGEACRHDDRGSPSRDVGTSSPSDGSSSSMEEGTASDADDRAPNDVEHSNKRERGGTDDSRDDSSVAPDPKSTRAQLETRQAIRFEDVPPRSDHPCAQMTRRVTLRNVGRRTLDIRAIRISKANRLFRVTYPPDDSPSTGSMSGSSGDGSTGKGSPGNDDGGCPMIHSEDRRPSGDGLWPAPEVDGALEPGETLDLRVWFRPETSEPVRTKLQIDWRGQGDDASLETSDVEILADTDTPCLEVTPSGRLDFDATTVGRPAERALSFQSCSVDADVSPTIEDIELADDAGGTFRLVESSLPESLARGRSLTLRDRHPRSVIVAFEPPDDRRYTGELLIETAESDRRRIRLDLVGRGTDNQCPRAEARAQPEFSKSSNPDSWRQKVTTYPHDTVDFRATKSRDPDGRIARYEWSILERPANSTARLRPSLTSPDPEIRLDGVGTYRFELIVYDDEGAASCGRRAIVEVDARPQSDIYLQLNWRTPGDPDPTDRRGTDLDIHYVRPTDSPTSNWTDLDNDIFWRNITADWGQQVNPDDDPALNIDDTNGQGPEMVIHNNPNDSKRYKVGVYYYKARGLGPSYATVDIYFNQTLVRRLEDRQLPEEFAFWYVGRIDWGHRRFLERNIVRKGYPGP